jgi:hypothetical protein
MDPLLRPRGKYRILTSVDSAGRRDHRLGSALSVLPRVQAMSEFGRFKTGQPIIVAALLVVSSCHVMQLGEGAAGKLRAAS